MTQDKPLSQHYNTSKALGKSPTQKTEGVFTRVWWPGVTMMSMHAFSPRHVHHCQMTARGLRLQSHTHTHTHTHTHSSVVKYTSHSLFVFDLLFPFSFIHGLFNSCVTIGCISVLRSPQGPPISFSLLWIVFTVHVKALCTSLYKLLYKYLSYYISSSLFLWYT